MASSFIFYFGLTLFFVHELDAIRCKEWRIIPGLSLLNNSMGFRVFTLLHIPLFFIILIALASSIKIQFIFWLNVFFIVHFFLHLIFLKHGKNEFKDWISWTIITGMAISGIMALII